MELLSELGPTQYKSYVNILNDEMTNLEKQYEETMTSVEEINKDRKFAQVIIYTSQQKIKETVFDPLNEQIQDQLHKTTLLCKEIGTLEDKIETLKSLKHSQ